MPLTWGLADAVEAGTIEEITWVDVSCQGLDLVLTTPRDALRCTVSGRTLRASLSYKEQIRVCRALGCVSPLVAWSRAIWQAAPSKQNPVELVRTAADAAQMGSFDFLCRMNDAIDAQLAGAGADAWGRGAAKVWAIDPMMTEQGATGACNLGFTHPDGKEDQPPGGRHDWLHLDYSQLCLDLCKRAATRLDGTPVDLLDLQCQAFPALHARLTEEYGAGSG
jgi:hypothetical protein